MIETTHDGQITCQKFELLGFKNALGQKSDSFAVSDNNEQERLCRISCSFAQVSSIKFLFGHRNLFKLLQHLINLVSCIDLIPVSTASLKSHCWLPSYCSAWRLMQKYDPQHNRVKHSIAFVSLCRRLLPAGQRRRRRESSDTQRQGQRLRLLGLGEERISVATSTHSRQLARQVRAVCQRMR